MKSIDDILNEDLIDEAPQVEAPPQIAEPAEQAKEPQPRDDAGKFAAKGVDEGAPPAPVDKLPQAEFGALKDERGKRQALEREVAEMRQALQALQAPPAPAPSMWEDEQGWQQHFAGNVVNQAVQQATINSRLDMSEMMARQANPDFEEIKAEFLALAADNPVLRDQALADPHPWHKAVQITRTHKSMIDLGATDMDTLKAKLREELAAEMQATPAARQGLPPTLTGVGNVGSRSGPAWAGPTPLSDILR